jgi:hypothetical protein
LELLLDKWTVQSKNRDFRISITLDPADGSCQSILSGALLANWRWAGVEDETDQKLTDGVLALGASSLLSYNWVSAPILRSLCVFLQTVVLYPVVVQLPFTRSAGPDSPIVAV